MYHDGARLYPHQELDWSEWSLQELLENCDVTPFDIDGLRPDEYVNKLAGWVNRLNEIRERLRCSLCDEMMIPNKKYAKNLAAYGVTVVSCQHGIGHDQNIYLNHCWGCEGQIIDSRESQIKVKGFYICLRCGTGPKDYPFYRQGDVCPKCGNIGMLASNREFTCPKCFHSIYIPPENRLTGILDIETRHQHLKELFSAS